MSKKKNKHKTSSVGVTKSTQGEVSSRQSPLRQLLWRAIRDYPQSWRPMTVALFLPLALIGAFRVMTDDYTGNQYALLIILTSIFASFVAARVAVIGWDMQKLRPLELYNSIMSRFLSIVGLWVVATLFAVPMIAGLFLTGLSLVADVSKLVLLLSLPLLVGGALLLSRVALAMYALADDMDITVAQAFQISSRITKRFYWAYLWRLICIGIMIVLGSIVLFMIGTLISGYIQDAQVQLFLDLFGGWLFTPFFIFLFARLYQGLVEAYE